ncbi:MAG: substrate binding domain-containing protein, partial [Pseudomonadota bacterium]
RLILIEKVVAFMSQYPQVEVELNFDDRNVDLASENIDVAVRIGALGDSANLVARKLFDDEMYTCAAPDYVQSHGAPQRVADLKKHRCMHYRVRTTGRFFPYMFQANGEVVRESFQPVLVANSVDALCQAAISGLGLAQLPSFLALPAIEKGALVEVMPEHRMPLRYSLIYLDRRLVSPRVRAFVDFMAIDSRPSSVGR